MLDDNLQTPELHDFGDILWGGERVTRALGIVAGIAVALAFAYFAFAPWSPTGSSADEHVDAMAPIATSAP